MATLILQGPRLTEHEAIALNESFGGKLHEGKGYYRIQTEGPIDAQRLAQHKDQEDFDINLLPDDFNPSQAKLLVTDMDSTLINIECVDEIADFINVKPEVAAITESAMRGEIDFPTSLRKRVGLLNSLDASALEHVYEERLGLNPGAEQMIEGLHNQDIKIVLVSGGFTFFTDRLKKRLNLDYTLANTLDIKDSKLTGQVKGDIAGAEAKAAFLLKLCDELNIKPSQTIAMGDGANDLLMMNEAGLSIAYRAKPKVQEQAHTALNHCGLEGVLGLLNIG
jgi:phosphoserine phosphatase